MENLKQIFKNVETNLPECRIMSNEIISIWTYLLCIVPVRTLHTNVEAILSKFLLLWVCPHSCESHLRSESGRLLVFLVRKHGCGSFFIDIQLISIWDDLLATWLAQGCKANVCPVSFNSQIVLWLYVAPQSLARLALARWTSILTVGVGLCPLLHGGEYNNKTVHVTVCLKAATHWMCSAPRWKLLTSKYVSLVLAKRLSTSFNACLKSPASMALHIGTCCCVRASG